MVGSEERDVLLASLRGYLDELRESGVEELPFAPDSALAPQPVASPVAPAAGAVPAAAGPALPAVEPASAPAPAYAAAPAPAPEDAPAASLPKLENPALSAAAAIEESGNPQARLLFVMAGGGLSEASGNLLAKIIGAMGFAPEQVLLVTLPFETLSSGGALRERLLGRIAEVAPQAVVALGEQAAQLVLDSDDAMSRLRGRFVQVEEVPVMATLHPDQLLADETLKRQVWNEMKKVMALLAQKG
ncbi:MAG TPA: uracil-DNA glycosylase family protein [Geomonas sp.]|nr:uracil-DNA glycosylase family protein [Geomonas sp.]